MPPDRLMIRFSLSPRAVPVKCERTRFGRLVAARTGSPRRAGVIADDIENLTGLAPRTFRDWCERHIDESR